VDNILNSVIYAISFLQNDDDDDNIITSTV